MSSSKGIFPLYRHYLENHNGADVQTWISNLFFKFHDDPMVNKYMIIVLLEQVLVYAGKERYDVNVISLTSYIVSENPMVIVFKNEFQTWCSSFTMIQRLRSSRSSFYWDRFGCMREKERILGEKEGKTKLRRRRSIETYRQFENWPNVTLFIARVLPTYYLLYFFIILLKKNFILFPIKWINKISFLFSFKPLF